MICSQSVHEMNTVGKKFNVIHVTNLNCTATEKHFFLVYLSSIGDFYGSVYCGPVFLPDSQISPELVPST